MNHDVLPHQWLTRWRAWRREARPGPVFDLRARLTVTDDELIARWAADLTRADRRWLNRKGVKHG